MAVGWHRRIMEIPVYFRTVTQHRERFDREVRRLSVEDALDDDTLKMNLEKNLWRYREYNDVAAWVYLYVDQWVVVSEAFERDARRITVRGTNRPFRYVGKVAEVRVNDGLTSEEIAADLRAWLTESLALHFVSAKRHPDLTAFDRLSPFIDWRGVLGGGRKELRTR